MLNCQRVPLPPVNNSQVQMEYNGTVGTVPCVNVGSEPINSCMVLKFNPISQHIDSHEILNKSPVNRLLNHHELNPY